MNAKFGLEPGWLRDDVKRAEERLREWSSKNIEPSTAPHQDTNDTQQDAAFESRKRA